VMPLLQSESGRSTDLEDIAHCLQLLGKVKVGFTVSLHSSTPELTCEICMRQDHVNKLPLLLDLVNINSSEAPPGGTKLTDASEAPPTKRQRKRSRRAQSIKRTTSFEPPELASAPGLACLLLLLEEGVSPLQLFGTSSCGPRLAIQCLSVRTCSCFARALSVFCTFIDIGLRF
jgi:hypothetical protein